MEALELAMEFTRYGFLNEDRRRYAIFLFGSFGVGKTWLATALLKELLYTMVVGGNDAAFKNPPIWIKFYQMIRQVQACYNPASETTTQAVIGRLQSALILLIDDIGDLEAQGDTEDRRRILYEVIDYRNDYMLPTIMTSNLDAELMRDHYGARSMERMIELCAFIEMEGENLRHQSLQVEA